MTFTKKTLDHTTPEMITRRTSMRVVINAGLRYSEKAFWLVILSFAVSCPRLSLSQSGDEADTNMTNGSDITPSCPANISCEDLPVRCIECEFDDNCAYGNTTEVACIPINTVNCTGQENFTRSFVCQYCYQLEDKDTCCELDAQCKIRATPSSHYIANCTANENVLCLPPRVFQKQVPCNRTSGRRWSTAFLLSFTLGGFGIDRFYLGHIGAGCGKLFTFGGLGVWSIMDVILVAAGYVGPADGSAYV